MNDEKFSGIYVCRNVDNACYYWNYCRNDYSDIDEQHNEQETIVAVKKAYSALGQANQRMIAQNGNLSFSSLGANEEEFVNNLGKKFFKNMKVQKTCRKNASDCFADDEYKLIDGSYWYDWVDDTTYYKVRLADDTSLSLGNPELNQSFGTSDALNDVSALIFLDVNGDKKPNTSGKDVFMFWLTSNHGVFLMGTPEETYRPLSRCRVNGLSCAAWVISRGNMDYIRKDISW